MNMDTKIDKIDLKTGEITQIPEEKEDILALAETVQQKGPRFLIVREGDNRKKRRRKQALVRKTKKQQRISERRRKSRSKEE